MKTVRFRYYEDADFSGYLCDSGYSQALSGEYIRAEDVLPLLDACERMLHTGTAAEGSPSVDEEWMKAVSDAEAAIARLENKPEDQQGRAV